MIGQIGFDPGTEWGSGLTSTADNTLRRKTTVEAGDADGSDAFDPASEWDGFATDTFAGVGAYPGLVVPADTAPSVAATSPAAGAPAVAVDDDVTVTFSEPVAVAAGGFALSCTVSGSKAFTQSGGPTTYTLDPTVDFTPGDSCTLSVTAASVSDVDTNDPPDVMVADFTSSFSVPAVDPCVAPITTIPTIQGSGATVAVTGPVTTRGVVVGDYEGASPALRGFYLQDATGDGNPATSDAIFVFEFSNADAVKLGDVVTVTRQRR